MNTPLLPAHASMTYISLFSGIGGFDSGFDSAGMHCAAQVEFDPKARAVLAHHWPHVKQFEDVKNVGKHNLPAVDLICGGFPCQDVSVAGRRAGLAGERSGLWFEFLRIITELTPRWVVIENVPGLLSSNSGRDFATVLQGLVECGYRVGWRVLDAQYFGLAQRRKRVFIVAGLTAAGANPAEVLFEREGSYGDIAPSRETRQGTTAATADGATGYRKLAHSEFTEDDKTSPVLARDAKSASDLVAYNLTFCDANGRRKDRVNGGLYVNETDQANTLDTGGAGEKTIVVGTLAASGAGSARPAGQRNETDMLVVNPIAFMAGQSAKAGSIAACEDFSPTIKGGASGTNQVPTIAFSNRGIDSKETAETLRAGSHGALPMVATSGVRRLTPIECERLQGFSDNWTAVNGQADSTRYKQLGNAVAVPVAAWLGKRLATAPPA